MEPVFTHLDANGAATMVDVSAKNITQRSATAQALITTRPDVVAAMLTMSLKKGDVFAVARVAGIMAAKKTADLIPLCHPLALSKVSIEFECNAEAGEVRVLAFCLLAGQTGVEMEALTAASIAALTIYDMCKAVDASMVISDMKLLEKTGGKNGHWLRAESND